MPNLNKTIVGNIQVPVPSAETLETFAKIKKRALGMKRTFSYTSKQKLFNSLSQKAFAGEL